MKNSSKQSQNDASLSMEEYKKRSIPRLKEIDLLDAKCEWKKHEFQVSPEVLQFRERRNALMADQNADECAAGL